ncbi:[Fe-S]-dependent transcriptional repressor FeoC [Metakosakonia massiliensis]|uniref:Probable [Fe-S]-dependent transcriptional repressor n=1 Tax=Phytobacter massiliensis TaxID=1485952 RepID=A0A6N3BHZ1_9ENTR
MASLLDIRNMLALQGRMEASQLSAALHLSPSLVEAMLLRMEAMGKAARVEEELQNCLTGECKNCPEGKMACRREWWTLTA